MWAKLSATIATLALIITACGGGGAAPPPPTPDPLLADLQGKPVELVTEDNVNLKATYYPPGGTAAKAPAVLLLHMLNSNKESWQDFAPVLQNTGYAVLALDLRGHGESSNANFNYTFMDRDADAALAWLRARPEINAEKIGIVGASIGANLALRAGSRNTNVKSVVLLSPGLDYRGVTTLDALAEYGQRPVMIVAAENDTYAADSSRTLNSQALGQHQLQIYPGADHGTNLLSAQAGLTPMILSWFATTMP
ncbi:MAG: alpha/beta fold hydrolase [Chloroflexi bacterium]|nr:MAG: alpha/beta fold hydrolase [Chloroflexota bacterium]